MKKFKDLEEFDVIYIKGYEFSDMESHVITTASESIDKLQSNTMDIYFDDSFVCVSSDSCIQYFGIYAIATDESLLENISVQFNYIKSFTLPADYELMYKKMLSNYFDLGYNDLDLHYENNMVKITFKIPLFVPDITFWTNEIGDMFRVYPDLVQFEIFKPKEFKDLHKGELIYIFEDDAIASYTFHNIDDDGVMTYGIPYTERYKVQKNTSYYKTYNKVVSTSLCELIYKTRYHYESLINPYKHKIDILESLL